MRRLAWFVAILACVGAGCEPAKDGGGDGSDSAEGPDTGGDDSGQAEDTGLPDDTGPEDADGDGWPAGADCDDASGAVYPGAQEACNGLDDDCDGAVDEADAQGAGEWYRDADGDGSGDADTPVTACDAPEGYVGTSDDCDDADSDVNPTAAEVCADGVDQDCDGGDARCLPSGDVVLSTAGADAVLYGETGGDYAGGAVLLPGDIDGDGIPDVLVSAMSSDVPDNGAGALYLFSGPVSGVAATSAATATITGEAYRDAFGFAAATVGDVDGDSLPDVIVGASGAGYGQVYLFTSIPAGPSSASDAALILLSDGETTSFGASVASAGDTDGDGVAEVLVGAYGAHGAVGGSGCAYVVSAATRGAILVADAASATFEGDGYRDYFGWSVASAGDTDGDGLDDVVVSAPALGAVYLFSGPLSGTYATSDATATFLSGMPDAEMSHLAGAGDLNADGLADVLVGFPQLFNCGSGHACGVALLEGPLAGEMGVSDATAWFYAEGLEDLFGSSVAFAGDVDADGDDDVLVGAQYSDAGAEDGGAAWLFLSPLSGAVDATTDARARFVGVDENDYAGRMYSLAGGSDLDLDGFEDFVVGAFGADPTGANGGAAFVFHGGMP